MRERGREREREKEGGDKETSLQWNMRKVQKAIKVYRCTDVPEEQLNQLTK